MALVCTPEPDPETRQVGQDAAGHWLVQDSGRRAARLAPPPVCEDARWPAVLAALAELRHANRHSIRILDMDCGAGSVLLHAVRHARALGFTAIEARGVDGVPALIGRARAAAAALIDPAIGISFETADLMTALVAEHDFPADILLWHGHAAGIEQPVVVRAVAAAAHRIITDAPARCGAR
ncbi:SAM-dependent methyltransferase [Sphingomonas sp. H39-1-10]|uniref:SAM-dependent methyltransferase n=1 Tax=Sphingomonas pollutisoli TaxID=3030829 RepID=UPI00088FFE30|nr:SAM-dependent methyltransferase [Sphingomonas pollutisoli]MDF0486673.1 SAM-dependent methyltransferase [Sphingomonas pollutisoli]SDA35575.1 hypothetical protein SAMN03159340_03310 [Sphingomonas sp. NFR15]